MNRTETGNEANPPSFIQLAEDNFHFSQLCMDAQLLSNPKRMMALAIRLCHPTATIPELAEMAGMSNPESYRRNLSRALQDIRDTLVGSKLPLASLTEDALNSDHIYGILRNSSYARTFVWDDLYSGLNSKRLSIGYFASNRLGTTNRTPEAKVRVPGGNDVYFKISPEDRLDPPYFLYVIHRELQGATNLVIPNRSDALHEIRVKKQIIVPPQADIDNPVRYGFQTKVPGTSQVVAILSKSVLPIKPDPNPKAQDFEARSDEEISRLYRYITTTLNPATYSVFTGEYEVVVPHVAL